MPVDKFTQQSKAHANIFALGDANDIPASKAGSVAHFEVDIFIDNFLQLIAGKEMTHKFDGHANCFIETGGGKAMLIDFNYDTEPLPGQVPVRRRRTDGPAQGEPPQPHRQARLPLGVLEHADARPPAADPQPDVARQASAPTSSIPSRGEHDMPTTTINGRDVHVDDEGFMTEYDEWDEDMGTALASAIGVDMTDDHWKVIRFLREDFKAQGETPTIRRVSTVGGVDTKQLFVLFPKKPAKKMAYIAGLPKPHGCV